MKDISLDDLKLAVRSTIRDELFQWQTVFDAKFAQLQSHMDERLKNTERLIASLELYMEERFDEVLASIGTVTESILDAIDALSTELSDHRKRIEALEMRCA